MIETKQIEAEAQSLAAQAADVVVTDAASYEGAAGYLKCIMAYQQNVRALFAPHKKAAHKMHADLCADEQRHLAAPEAAEKLVKIAMVHWAAAEDRRIAEARRQAEAEAKRIAEDQQLAEAAAAEAAGEAEVAQSIMDQPIMVAPPPVVRAAPKVAGVAVITRWDAEVTDLAALVRAVAAGKAPLAMVQANMVVVRGQARSLKGECRLPGVRVFSVQGIAAGAR